VAVLAAIAFPMYSKYVKKSRTSEAVSNLGAIALYEETFYSEMDRYQLAVPNPTGNPPSPADTGGRKQFSSGLTGWVSLGKVIPDNTNTYFQYEVLAGQFDSASTPASVTTTGLVAHTTNASSGVGFCSNPSWTINAAGLAIPVSPSSNWFFATAVGNQDGDTKCSRFIKVVDRTDIVVQDDIE
jgi:type II secretory pathway pseudopilin PulG